MVTYHLYCRWCKERIRWWQLTKNEHGAEYHRRCWLKMKGKK